VTRFEVVSWGLLTASAVFLASMNVVLQSRNSDDLTSDLEPGAHVPELLLALADGGEVRIPFPESEASETLLIMFSTSCWPCVRALPVYREMASTKCDLGIGFVILDLSHDELTDWWQARREDWGKACAPIAVGRPAHSLGAYSVRLVPTHYLIDSGGTVLGKMVGAHPEDLQDLRRDWTP